MLKDHMTDCKNENEEVKIRLQRVGCMTPTGLQLAFHFLFNPLICINISCFLLFLHFIMPRMVLVQ